VKGPEKKITGGMPWEGGAGLAEGGHWWGGASKTWCIGRGGAAPALWGRGDPR